MVCLFIRTLDEVTAILKYVMASSVVNNAYKSVFLDMLSNQCAPLRNFNSILEVTLYNAGDTYIHY